MRTHWLLGLLVAVLLVGCDETTTPNSNLESSQSAIINGDTETGWPAVGALTLWYPGYGYQGNFCTATLIAPQWVLTAAHCLTEQEGMEMDPDIVYFLVGNDARPNYQGNPTDGTLYDVDMFYVHPNYDPNDAYTEADIGLVHLAQPITGVSTLPINTSYMGSSWVGSELFYVGFGVTSGTAQEGSGLKRSTYMPVESVGSSYYYSQFDGSGICFGDSGGPGIGNVSGTNKVVGVNSSVAGTGYDPCQGTSLQTRVDVYSSWISGILGGTPPNCNSLPDLCMCDGACQTNGSCNNDVCKTMDCEAVYLCMVDCPGTDIGCQAECYAGGTSQATTQLDALFACMANYCDSVSDSQFQTCVQNNCSNEISTCMPVGTGSLNCEDTYTCMVECSPSDQQCQYDCYESATGTAQSQLDALFACMSDQCDGLSDDQYSQCVYDKCESELYTCMPADNCDIAGGDCAPGTACYPTGDGVTTCYTSNSIGEGGACDPNLTDSLACADGLICISDGGEATCVQMCIDNAPCASGETCKGPIFTGITDIGICLCTDGDNDGACADVDCDDGNSSVYPGANEICDGKDNNCNGQIDEGCPDDCVDLDADNVCAQDDCNDNNASIYPGAPETCGDGIDNNCNGQTDENCDGPCVDNDADGYCASVDCNDNDNSIFPNAGELCDGKDNNCNNQVDEGCQSDPDVITQDDSIQQQQDVIAQQEDAQSQTDSSFNDPSNDPSVLTNSGGCSHNNTPTSTTPALLLLTLLTLAGIRRFAM